MATTAGVRLRLVSLLLGVLVCAPRVRAWQTLLERPGPPLMGTANDVAVGKDGTLFAAGGTPFFAAAFLVVALSPETGEVLWRFDGGPGIANGVVVDAAGDVIAVGQATGMGGYPRATAVKLAAGTGAQIWRSDRDGAAGNDVNVDAAGDVVVAATRVEPPGASVFRAGVLKLDGADGAILWDVPLDPLRGGRASLARIVGGTDVAVFASLDGPTVDVAYRLAGADGSQRWRWQLAARHVDRMGSSALETTPTGSVVVGFHRYQGTNGGVTTFHSVTMLSGIDGKPVWTHEEPSSDVSAAPVRVEIHPTGDVIAGLRFGSVLRLNPEGGDVLWRRELGCGSFDGIAGLAVHGAGDVLVALQAPDCVGHPQYRGPLYQNLVAARLAAADGAERWRRAYGGAKPGSFLVNALAASSAGDAVLAGAEGLIGGPFVNPSAFAVVSLDAEDGALGVCNDGFLDAGEACDDGTLFDEDCCPRSCTVSAPDGMQFSCRAPTASAKAVVAVVDKRRARGDALVWSWRTGEATSKLDFGDPVAANTDFALCMYARDFAGPIFVARIPGNAACAPGARCWSRTDKGYEYRARSARPSGIRSVSLKAGADGRARIVVRGRGPALEVPAPPYEGPIMMQLVKTDGSAPCWEATHDLVRTNRTRRFVATNR